MWQFCTTRAVHARPAPPAVSLHSSKETALLHDPQCRMLYGVLLKSGFEFFVTRHDDDSSSTPQVSLHGLSLQSEVAASWSSFELQVSHPLHPHAYAWLHPVQAFPAYHTSSCSLSRCLPNECVPLLPGTRPLQRYHGPDDLAFFASSSPVPASGVWAECSPCHTHMAASSLSC